MKQAAELCIAEKTSHTTGSNTTKDDHVLRVGQIKFTNALPICHFLEKNDPAIQFRPGAPTELNKWLAEGTVDCGLVSAFAYAERADEYVALRGLSVSSRGPVGSIFLFSKKPIEELDGCTVALTTMSASSINLAKVLLGEMGLNVNYLPHESDLPRMMEKADAAVLIADDALHWSVQPHGYYRYDLGEEWNKLTGLSMTFAVVAVPKKLLATNPEKVRKIHRFFLDGKRKGYADMEAVIREATRMMGQSEAFWRNYFAKLIHDLDDDLVTGLEAFFDAAHRHGLLPKPVKVELWGDDE